MNFIEDSLIKKGYSKASIDGDYLFSKILDGKMNLAEVFKLTSDSLSIFKTIGYDTEKVFIYDYVENKLEDIIYVVSSDGKVYACKSLFDDLSKRFVESDCKFYGYDFEVLEGKIVDFGFYTGRDNSLVPCPLFRHTNLRCSVGDKIRCGEKEVVVTHIFKKDGEYVYGYNLEDSEDFFRDGDIEVVDTINDSSKRLTEALERFKKGENYLEDEVDDIMGELGLDGEEAVFVDDDSIFKDEREVETPKVLEVKVDEDGDKVLPKNESKAREVSDLSLVEDFTNEELSRNNEKAKEINAKISEDLSNTINETIQESNNKVSKLKNDTPNNIDKVVPRKRPTFVIDKSYELDPDELRKKAEGITSGFEERYTNYNED